MARKKQDRRNNFDMVRMIAVFMVMAGHMGFILGKARPMLLGTEVHLLGVKILFLLSGYFITLSWESDRNVFHYALKRLSRIWPPLIVAILVTALIIGPIFTTYTMKDYFSDWLFGIFIYGNILFKPVFALPGVFSEAIYPNAVNGSLWTIPVELFCYFLVPIVASFCVRKRTKKELIVLISLTAAICILELVHLKFFPDSRLVFYGTNLWAVCDLLPFFFIGMLFTYKEVQRFCNLPLAICVFALFSCIELSLIPGNIMLYLVLPYMVFSFGLEPNATFSEVFTPRSEISYGIYLFGFTVQQAVTQVVLKLGLPLSYTLILLVSLFFTVILAYLLRRFVELPIQRLTNKILRKKKKTAVPAEQGTGRTR